MYRVTPSQPNPQALYTTLHGHAPPRKTEAELPTYDAATRAQPGHQLQNVENRLAAIVPAPAGLLTATLDAQDLHHQLHFPRGELLQPVRDELQKALTKRRETDLSLQAAREGLEALRMEEAQQQRATAPDAVDVGGGLFESTSGVSPWLEQQIKALQKEVKRLEEEKQAQAVAYQEQLRKLAYQHQKQALSPSDQRKAQKLELKKLKIEAKLRSMLPTTLN